jgi:hypothetical protein
MVFQAKTKLVDDKILSDGGRVLGAECKFRMKSIDPPFGVYLVIY